MGVRGKLRLADLRNRDTGATPVHVPIRPAAFHAARLESSALYQRREMDARQAEQQARLQALWYLASDYRARLAWQD